MNRVPERRERGKEHSVGAGGETLSPDPVDWPATEALVLASAAVAAWALGRAEGGDVRRALETAAERADPVAVEEMLLQSYLFLGYPAALNALSLWREVSGREANPPERWDPAEWEARGEDVCGRVYGGQYHRLRENIRALHPDMERWMVVEGYGKVLGRPGLELWRRELCVVAVLAVAGWPTQLYSHLRGALQAGAEPEAVARTLDAALAMAGAEEEAEARAAWERVRARGPGGAPDTDAK